MSETLRRVQTLVLAGDYRVSDDGYEELRKDAILIGDVVAGITTAELVKDYRTRDRVLAVQYGADGRPIHVVWAYRRGADKQCSSRHTGRIEICGTLISGAE